MGKLIRFVGLGIVAIVVLVVAAVVVLPMVVDPNDFKGQIAEAVESSTGRQLDMQGDLGLSVFPWLGLEIGNTALSNAEGFSDQPFAQVEQVQVKVKLMPLLRKTLEMDTVVLKGLRVSMETDAQGNNNWSDLGGEPGEPEAEQAAPAEDAAGMALAGLAIGGVEISDAALLWDDRQANARYQVDNINLHTGAIASGAAVPVRLRLRVAAEQPAIQGPIEFKGTVAVSDDTRRVQVDGARLTTDLSGAGLPAGKLESQLDFNSKVDLEQQTLEISGLVLELLELKISGDLKGEKILDDAAFNGSLKISEFVPREVIEALGQAVPEVSDPAVLGKADGELQLAATKTSFSVPQLRLRLDDSIVEGKLSVNNFAKPATRFELHLDEIDVDRYLPPPGEEPATPATPTTAAAAGAQLIPVDTLRTLDINGKLTIARLKAAQLRSTDILIQVLAKNGVLRVHPASAKMYQGEYQGDVSLNVQGKQPKISMNERLSGVQIGPLLKDMLGKDHVSGMTRASAKLTATGQTADELQSSLNGDVAFALTDGAVSGFNLAQMLRNASATIKSQAPTTDSGQEKTDFSELSGTASVTNGVINNQDLSAKSPLLRVEGRGTVDLPRQALDYLVTAKVVGSLEGQSGKGLGDLRGVSIPVQVSGTFAEPAYSVRLDEALRGVAEEKIKEQVKEQQEKVQEKLGEELEKKLGDGFKGLFNK